MVFFTQTSCFNHQFAHVVFVVVQSLSCVQLFATPWTAARQAFLSFAISQNLLKLMSIESVMPSNHLILCRPLLLLPSIFPSIRVFSHESLIDNKKVNQVVLSNVLKFASLKYMVKPLFMGAKIIASKFLKDGKD